MKKILAVLCALCILLTSGLSAFAVNGPNEAERNFSYVKLVKKTEDGDWKIEAQLFAGYKDAEPSVAPEGAVYDKATNTVTLTNYSHADMWLVANEMGDDFKLRVVGENRLQQIRVYGFYHGGSIEICGDGSLILNENRENCPIIMNAEVTAGIFKVDNSVSFTAYCYKNDAGKLDTVAYFDETTSKTSPLIIEGALEAPLKEGPNFGSEHYVSEIARVAVAGDFSWEFETAKLQGSDTLYGLEHFEGINGRFYYQIYALVEYNGQYMAIYCDETEDDVWPAKYKKTSQKIEAVKDVGFGGAIMPVLKNENGEQLYWGQDKYEYDEDTGYTTVYYTAFKKVSSVMISGRDGEYECIIAEPAEGFQNITTDYKAFPDGYSVITKPAGTYYYTYVENDIKAAPRTAKEKIEVLSSAPWLRLLPNGMLAVSAGAKAADILSKISSGTAFENGGEVKTGAVIKLTNGEKVLDSVTLIVRGDADKDGNITASDARLALRQSVNLESLDAAALSAADVDGAAGITAADARLILRASVNLETPESLLA